MGNSISQFFPYQRGTAVGFAVTLIAASHFLPSSGGLQSTVLSLVHLGSFSMWFGIQFWVTFIAGLTMMKILPRHWFGKVQSVLFSKYFLIGMLLNGTMLSSFIVSNPIQSWNGQTFWMGSGLILGSLLTCFNSVFVDPHVAITLVDMHKYEKEHGHGDEIGSIKSGDIVNDEKYLSLKKKFFMYHGFSLLANLGSFAVSGIHLWFLANKLQI